MVGSVARDHVLAVRGHIEIVHGPFRTDALDLGERGGIDDIRYARIVPNLLPDPHIHSPSVRTHSDVVGVAGERDLLDHFQRLGIGHIERVVSLTTEVDPASVRGASDPMDRLDAFDLSHNLVRDGIKDVYCVSGGVTLNDPTLI